MNTQTQAKPSFLQRAAAGIKQYATEVVTGQKLAQNFFDSRSFDQWFAHGATEVANVLLHSHAAPL